MFLVAVASSFTAIVAGILLFGVGIGWFVPNLMTALSRRVTHEQQGRAVGIIKSAHYLGSPIGVLMVEPIARVGGPASAMMVGAAVSLCTVAAFLLMRLRPPRSAEPVIAAFQ